MNTQDINRHIIQIEEILENYSRLTGQERQKVYDFINALVDENSRLKAELREDEG